ncbi:MAG: hypothetical protein Q7S13_02595 [Candidatus Omnitrophota bacterium]|nr:hypothetical protein [Candidatus Omnitrophota bacterium]
MVKKSVNALRVVVCAVLTVQLMGCGTILYPERKGQKSGHIDVGVAILDGIGLLFFLIPGVIAFAVDFNNGTIYLPGTSRVSLDMKDIKQVKFDARHASTASIEGIIKEQTGFDIALDQPDIVISRLRSTDDLTAKFAEVLSVNQNERIALR